LYENGPRRISEHQVQATSYLNAMLVRSGPLAPYCEKQLSGVVAEHEKAIGIATSRLKDLYMHAVSCVVHIATCLVHKCDTTKLPAAAGLTHLRWPAC
jgi:hypothetical protein